MNTSTHNFFETRQISLLSNDHHKTEKWQLSCSLSRTITRENTFQSANRVYNDVTWATMNQSRRVPALTGRRQWQDAAVSELSADASARVGGHSETTVKAVARPCPELAHALAATHAPAHTGYRNAPRNWVTGARFYVIPKPFPMHACSA